MDKQPGDGKTGRKRRRRRSKRRHQPKEMFTIKGPDGTPVRLRDAVSGSKEQLLRPLDGQ